MILFNDISSIVESIYTGIGLSQNPLKADTIVNPKIDIYYNKTIIINNYYDYVDFKKLSANNHLISRIPLDVDNYSFEPYDGDREFPKIELNQGHSTLLLSPSYFSRDSDVISPLLSLPNFILSTGTSYHGYDNIAGFISKKLDLQNNSIKDIRKVHDLMKDRISIINLGDTKIKDFKQFNSLNSPTIDIESDDYCFTGPTVVIRTPNKRMNVKKNYIVNKFKTYRITDPFRSYNLRFNTVDGFYLFEPINRSLNYRCLEQFEHNNGFDICLYLLYYFCKKNHFKTITGDILTEPLQCLACPDGNVSLRLKIFPDEKFEYDPEVFTLSLFGNSRSSKKTRDYLTFLNYGKR